MAEISRSERLLNLISFLLKSRRPVTQAEILDSVAGYREGGASGASIQRRFERDKATLRELGVPLKYVSEEHPGGPGYVIPRESYFLPRIELTARESALLAAAGRLAASGAVGPLADALRSAVRKLQFDSPHPNLTSTDEEHFILHREPTGDPAEEANLRGLTNAALARHAVKFSYYGIGRDRISRRTVEPYGIGFSGGYWYLVGFDRGRREIRVFRIDRIRGRVKKAHKDAAGPEFDVPADFKVADYVGVPPWLFGRWEPVVVRLHFDSDVGFMVKLRPAPGDEWEDQPDGSTILTRRATNPEALLGWVLGFGRHVRVLEPEGLRRAVKETLLRIAEMHGDGGTG